ncbi:MAG: translocation/assembly module TamB domain-containing protein [Candidatus Korobacteraceae bacterium]|jgi:translocation and assembly module TamB
MTEDVKTRHPHKRLWIGVTVGVVLLAVIASLAWYLRSPSFEDFVRRKLIANLEGTTGGRVEMAAFHWNLSQLAFEADGLTIHGLEPAGESPYAHVGRALVRLHVIALFERRFSLEQIELWAPAIHIIVNPDGSTNAPEPKVKPEHPKTPVQQLFDLAVARVDVHDGMLLLNQHKLALDFSVNQVIAAMTYDRLAHRYDASVQVGKMDAKYQDLRDVAAQADLQLSLWHNQAEIKALKIVSEGSSLQVSGKVTDFQNPQVQLTYSSTIDVAQLGAVTRVYPLRGGTIVLDGLGTYSEAAGYASTGRIAVRDLDYLNEEVVLRKANLDSNFSLDHNNLSMTRIAARLLGGTLTGDAQVKNLWPNQLTPIAPTPAEPIGLNGKKVPRNTSQVHGTPAAVKSVSAQPEEGSARLRVNGLSLSELARMASSRSLPLDKLNAVGSVTGSVNLRWEHVLADAFADLALDISAPAQPSNNQLPISGHVSGRYGARSGNIELSALSLTTPHTHLDATGGLGATSAALKLTVNTTSLTEFAPMLTAMGNAPPPIELAGAAHFSGTLSGRLRTPEIAGHLQATNFTLIYTPALEMPAPPKPPAPAKHKSWFHLASNPAPPPQPVAQTRRIHVDQFSGDVQYSQSEVGLHHAVVQEAGAQLTLDGSTSLDRGDISRTSQFQVQAAMKDADIAELERALGVDYPVGGKLNFTLHAAGTADDPHGQGQISLKDGQAHGRPIRSLTSKIAFANHAVQFEGIHLQAAHGIVSGDAAYNFHSREVKLDLTGQSIDLAEIPEVQQPHLQIAGVANFTVKGSGTRDEPVINGHGQIGSLMLNGDTVGNFTADAVTRGRQVTLTARSNFPKASLTLDGNVDLQGDMPASATLRFANLDVNPFLPEAMRNQVTRQASLDGEGQLTGPLKQPRLLHASLSIKQLSVEVEHIPIKSDGPVELSLAGEIVTVQRCTMISDQNRLTVTGTASFAGDRSLNLSADGSLNLKLAETLDPDVTSYGAANVDVKIGGTMTAPLMSGRAEVLHAGLSTIDLPLGLGDVNGTLVFNQNRLEVENVAGRMGGGHVKFGGFVTFGTTVGFNLTVDGNDIRFRYSGISVTSDQALQLNGTLQNSSVTGTITVTRFAQIPSGDMQFLLAQATAPPRIPNPKSPLNNLRLEVRVLSTPALTVQTSLAKLSGDIDLHLRGTAARPVLLGRVNIAEGDIKVGGTKFHLERADITFLNPVVIDPVLDVEATTQVRDYDITIGLHGTMERLNTTYRSDPPLSSDDIISLLAFGSTQSENAMGVSPSPGFAESASGALLSSALNQAVTNRVSKLFGASSIRINPSFGGPQNDPNARITIEQQVTNNITLTYVTDLARSGQEVIQFEYNINSEYSVQGLRDENGVVSFDLLIRKRKQ